MAAPAILREIRRKTFPKPQKFLKLRENTALQKLHLVKCKLVLT